MATAGTRIRTVIVWLLIALLLGFFLTRDSGKVKNTYTRNSGIVAFGDSLVEGTGSEIGGGFVTFLERDLNIDIVNLGKEGDTTLYALNRVNLVTERKPAVTILLIGGNDFFTGTSEETTIKNISRIIEHIYQSGSAVILVGVQAAGPIGERHRAIFDYLANKYKTAYVPNVLEGILGRKELMSDNIHPNDEGYKIIAERIKPVLEKLIR